MSECVRCGSEYRQPREEPGLKVCPACWRSNIPDYWLGSKVAWWHRGIG